MPYSIISSPFTVTQPDYLVWCGAPVDGIRCLLPKKRLSSRERAVLRTAAKMKGAVVVVVSAAARTPDEADSSPEDFDPRGLKYLFRVCDAVAFFPTPIDPDGGEAKAITSSLRNGLKVAMIRVRRGTEAEWWPVLAPYMKKGLRLIQPEEETAQ